LVSLTGYLSLQFSRLLSSRPLHYVLMQMLMQMRMRMQVGST
jgi:hypothetical protein